MSQLGRILIFAGVALVIVGAIVMLLGRTGIQPFGNLPGDLSWERGNTRVYFPLGTMIVVSIVLTILINLILRLFR